MLLYPFRRRPSPFFEFYVETSNIIHDGDEESLTDLLVEKMRSDLDRNKWPRWKKHTVRV